MYDVDLEDNQILQAVAVQVTALTPILMKASVVLLGGKMTLESVSIIIQSPKYKSYNKMY